MGTGGGPRKIGDVKSLIDRAKEELRHGEAPPRRSVFISFAYDDIDEVNLLRAHAKNERSPIEFNDWSVSEPIDSDRAPYVKQKIRERIAQSSVTVVFLTDKTRQSEWVAWEIQESLARDKHVIGVFAGDKPPAKLPEVVTANKIKCVPWAKLAETIEKLK